MEPQHWRCLALRHVAIEMQILNLIVAQTLPLARSTAKKGSAMALCCKPQDIYQNIHFFTTFTLVQPQCSQNNKGQHLKALRPWGAAEASEAMGAKCSEMAMGTASKVDAQQAFEEEDQEDGEAPLGRRWPKMLIPQLKVETVQEEAEEEDEEEDARKLRTVLEFCKVGGFDMI